MTKRVCILCEDNKVSKVRKNQKNQHVLTIPLSKNGKLPATHWFCCLTMEEEKANKYVQTAELTTIEICEPNEFLEKWNLQIVK